MKPENLNQSRDLPHNTWPNPDIAQYFNVFFVLVIDAFGSVYIYLYAAKNCVTKYNKAIDYYFLE